MLGTKINKPVEDFNHYAEVAQWCNANMAKIVEHDDYYEVVDNHPTEEELKEYEKQRLTAELSKVTEQIAQLQGASVCGLSVDDDTEYDVLKDGELVTMNETEFNAYFDELTDNRSDIVKQLRALK